MKILNEILEVRWKFILKSERDNSEIDHLIRQFGDLAMHDCRQNQFGSCNRNRSFVGTEQEKSVYRISIQDWKDFYVDSVRLRQCLSYDETVTDDNRQNARLKLTIKLIEADKIRTRRTTSDKKKNNSNIQSVMTFPLMDGFLEWSQKRLTWKCAAAVCWLNLLFKKKCSKCFL